MHAPVLLTAVLICAFGGSWYCGTGVGSVAVVTIRVLKVWQSPSGLVVAMHNAKYQFGSLHWYWLGNWVMRVFVWPNEKSGEVGASILFSAEKKEVVGEHCQWLRSSKLRWVITYVNGADSIMDIVGGTWCGVGCGLLSNQVGFKYPCPMESWFSQSLIEKIQISTCSQPYWSE